MQSSRYKTGIAICKHMEHVCTSDPAVSTALSNCTEQILEVSVFAIESLHNDWGSVLADNKEW